MNDRRFLRGRLLGAALALAMAMTGCGGGGSGGGASGTPQSPQHYRLGGTLAGATGPVTLQDAGGGSLTVSANGAFSFATGVSAGAAYSVTVGSPPAGQSCTVANGSGTMGTADVSNIVVTCSSQSYTLGGTITGLTASGLVLANGSATVAPAVNAASFSFPQGIATVAAYNVVVQSQPSGLQCLVSNGSGTMGATPVNTVAVSCAPAPVPGTFTVLHAFTDVTTAYSQEHGTLVLASDGNYYGTVFYGSTSTGFVYRVTPSGAETVVHAFAGGAEGYHPSHGLVVGSDGNLYGITEDGGSGNAGTIYRLTLATGAVSTVYAFGSGPDDGSHPSFLLASGDGNLYGVTASGGNHGSGYGTIFKFAIATGMETPLYAFGSDPANLGQQPNSLVLASDGNLYGTTYAGANNIGTAFKMVPASGSLPASVSTLHSFCGASDGCYPASLMQGRDGNLYGTAQGGPNGAGVVFRLTPAGAITILHAFTGGLIDTDGATPEGPVLQASDGNFYGVTKTGGGNNLSEGTIYQMTPAGTVTILHRFSGTDGAYPTGALIQGSDGQLYGTTSAGGTATTGTSRGTVFKVVP